MTQTPTTNFWKWFEKNHEQLLNLPNKSEEEVAYWKNKLNKKLQAIHKYVNCTIEYEDGQAVLTITVDAYRRLFKKLDEMIDEAPVLPGWTFNALLPPGKLDDVVEQLAEIAGIDPTEFRFSFRKPKPNKRAEIVVFHPSYTPENDIPIFEVADRTILNLLGERCFGNNIEEIDVTHLSNAEPDKLEQLNVLKSIFSSGFVVGGEGQLTGLSRNLE